MRSLLAVAAVAVLLGLAVACAPTTNMGMVRDEATGYQFGSVVERSLTTDPSFYRNRRIKLRLRNTSGDLAFDMGGFGQQLREAYRAAGYTPVEDDSFGLLLDVNVTYSGHIQQTLTREYGFLGGAVGGAAGLYRGRDVPAAVGGLVAGAALGSIMGSYMAQDTYIVISTVTFGTVREPLRRDGRTVIFDRSIQGHPEDDLEEEERRRRRSLRDSVHTRVAVYAGGRNVRQGEISGATRERLARILSGFL